MLASVGVSSREIFYFERLWVSLYKDVQKAGVSATQHLAGRSRKGSGIELSLAMCVTRRSASLRAGDHSVESQDPTLDRAHRMPRDAPEPRIESTFRNGSLTAFSVVIGFSLSFLTRWAELPGAWHHVDIVALSTIILGSSFQIMALARLLSVQSLLLARYNGAVRLFLTGLGLTALGVLIAVGGDVLDYGERRFGG